MTIEQKVAAAILEKPTGTLEIGGKIYHVSPPTTGTLILVSEIVSTLPPVVDIPDDKIVASVLRYARDYKALGEIAAVLILGRKGLTETIKVEEEVEVSRHLFGLVKRVEKVEREKIIDHKAELAEMILDEVSPSVLLNVIVRRLRDMEIGDFFAITTSLSEANILAPTREVD